MRLKYSAVRLASLILLASLSFAPAFAKTVLPDACGDNKVEFEIKTMKDQPPPAAPESGKAMIVFVGTVPRTSISAPPPIRFGVDGSWAGATKSKSYFVVSVAPGEHHLCAAFQAGAFKSFKSAVPVDITAEAGKVYYYEAVVNVTQGAARPMVVGGGAPGQPPPTVVGGGGGGSVSFSFIPISDAEGKISCEGVGTQRLDAEALSGTPGSAILLAGSKSRICLSGAERKIDVPLERPL